MTELPKTYDPKSVEPKWYAHWIKNHDFEADPTSSKRAFSMVIPPPNITGVLTLGHVLNNTIQDVLARRAGGFCRSFPPRPDLSRSPDDQLGSRCADCPLRRGSHF